ncbi:c-type cytochrome [Alcaligenes faecalis]|uniref:c-type cytochrome n=1 Tax=Alcaligenes faecalis TaxID=511 RepID=UPI0029339733|nr:cytochrome c [Alcaligenes faecalis]MDV2116560.1 cytochrome c [Alcaligenes faecalis]
MAYHRPTTQGLTRHALKTARLLTLVGLGSVCFSTGAAAEQVKTLGQKTYEKTCIYCHEAGIGPELKGRQLPPEFFAIIVRSGLRAMPAFPQTHISDATLKELGQYLSTAPAQVPASASGH